MPKIHPRELVCNKARTDLDEAVAGALEKHELTEAEELRVLNEVFHRYIGSIAKYAIRRERHGNEDKPGGLE